MEAISVPKGFKVTPEQFDRLADIEQTARMELTKDGELIVMSPTGGEAGRKNFNLYLDLGNWNRQKKLGEAFDSSTIFVLPNGARRSPDVSWIKLDRWNNLTLKEKQGFPPLPPDFVIELVSPSDLKNQRYEDLQAKMQEYLDNGVRLGWLIEPAAKTVEIYRLDKQVEVLNHPKTLSGESLLPGFVLDLKEIF
ncbi:Uma2 family endonuclease [Waterburya agarophytonicola K14]|uniref:Uma2 family endonuclease n=1 Tax=Waterburya agarophytonicola KI4 TaxID=2874699 RepID=A0A964BLH3_9CYAN|nr:Uma2 family endonuclease [Waterburya agarophytonicola]MCC0175575.1 Uma2 family endonuclease [Waterburya agarophytonicola KI4]